MTAIRDLLVAFTDQDRASRRQGWVVCAVVLGLLLVAAMGEGPR